MHTYVCTIECSCKPYTPLTFHSPVASTGTSLRDWEGQSPRRSCSRVKERMRGWTVLQCYSTHRHRQKNFHVTHFWYTNSSSMLKKWNPGALEGFPRNVVKYKRPEQEITEDNKWLFLMCFITQELCFAKEQLHEYPLTTMNNIFIYYWWLCTI